MTLECGDVTSPLSCFRAANDLKDPSLRERVVVPPTGSRDYYIKDSGRNSLPGFRIRQKRGYLKQVLSGNL